MRTPLPIRFLAVLLIAASSVASISARSSGDQPDSIRLIEEPGEEGGWPKGWRPLFFRKIERHTAYTFIHEEGRGVIRGESHQSASGLYIPVDQNPENYPILSWCWKIDRIIAKGDETRKDGDDYAARIYVTFRYNPDSASLWEKAKYGAIRLIYGEYPPKAAINYVWANHLPKGQIIPNPYTARAAMVAVESGPEGIGAWRCESRNIVDDFRAYFGSEPPLLLGIAVMTDTDNTREEATGYYSDLYLRKNLSSGP